MWNGQILEGMSPRLFMPRFPIFNSIPKTSSVLFLLFWFWKAFIHFTMKTLQACAYLFCICVIETCHLKFIEETRNFIFINPKLWFGGIIVVWTHCYNFCLSEINIYDLYKQENLWLFLWLIVNKFLWCDGKNLCLL